MSAALLALNERTFVSLRKHRNFRLAFHGLAPAGGLLIGWLIEVGGTDLAFEVAGLSALAMVAVLLPRRPFERPA